MFLCHFIQKKEEMHALWKQVQKYWNLVSKRNENKDSTKESRGVFISGIIIFLILADIGYGNLCTIRKICSYCSESNCC